MDRLPNYSLLRYALVLAALLLVGLASTPPSGAGQPDTPPTTKLDSQSQPKNQDQAQPGQNGPKTKLPPTDLLPSLLSPRTRTGGVDNLGSVMSHDADRMRRSVRTNTRINRDMRWLNNSIRDMRTHINRTWSIQRRRY